jgi:signal transduction histidine kinase/CheY-like chemotaxis protein
MAWCPAYAAPICSLCCSLDSRCHDMCKPHARLNTQVGTVAAAILPQSVLERLASRLGRYAMTTLLGVSAIGAILAMIAYQVGQATPANAEVIYGVILIVFFVFAILTAIVSWFYVLAHDSRVVAEEESSRQNTLLLKEIAAHKKTDSALQQAKETAEAANRAKSRYVVGLSHELRTPLNAVMGYAQILERDETIPPPRQSAIKVIRRSADHLSGLIDGLLDISKIEAGRLQVYTNEINIQDFLDQIVEMFRLQAQAKGLLFEHVRSAALPRYVRTDEKRLRQILVNLLSNAIKFTDQGKIGFDVSYRSQVATFTVTDTGSGIAEKDLHRIYEPFQRGDSHDVQARPGLGLGLTITHLLTNTLGGEISAASTKGEGSIFKVRLMLSAVERPNTTPAAERKIVSYTGPRRTIVVVDDNEDHRDLMREILAPMDFVILTASSGPDCITLIEGVKPDLFLVDISMPGMNGWQLVARLRELGQAAPIIMLSANIGDGAAADFGDEGHNDTIGKPVEFRRLADKLAAHLGLTWIYEDEVPPTQPAAAQPMIISPGAHHLQDLLRLGEIGYVRGIEAKLADLAKDETHRPFAEEVGAYIRAFDLSGYMNYLSSLEKEASIDG